MSKTPTVRPQYRAASGYWDWAAVLTEARRHPGVWWLVAPSVSRHAVRSVNERRHPALHTTDGRLRARGINPHSSDGQDRIDLLVAFFPISTERNSP